MRKQTDIYPVYKFSELPEKVQQNLVEEQCQVSSEFFGGAEWVYKDAAMIADLFGLDINTRTGKNSKGETTYSPNIYYSGFWHPGDGACFEGNYQYKAGSLKAVKAFAPQDTTLHRIVKDLQRVQSRNFYQLTASTDQRGHYYHSGCMQVTVERQDGKEMTADAEEIITQAFRAFADWIYDKLEDAYNWDTSEENARDYLENNDDDEYKINGERI